MITNREGRQIDITLPPTIAELATKSTLDEYAKLEQLRAGLAEHRDAATRLEADVERAEADRAAAIKTAALAAKALPTKDPVKPLREELELARARVEGFADAVAEQELACVDAFEANRDAFIAEAVKRRDAAAAKLAKAVEAWADARRDFGATLADAKWIEQFPQANLWNPRIAASLILDVHPGDGGHVPVSDVEAMLRKDADVDERMMQRPNRSIGGGPMPVPQRDEQGRPIYGKLQPLARQVAN